MPNFIINSLYFVSFYCWFVFKVLFYSVLCVGLFFGKLTRHLKRTNNYG